MTAAPDDDRVLAFWAWLEGVAHGLARDFTNPRLLEELDRAIDSLGEFGWELGPGIEQENMLAISPDGVPERLPITLRIVAMAPEIPGWEFFAARRPRPTLWFTLESSRGDIDVEPEDWKYVLHRFPGGVVDLVLEQTGLHDVSDDDRQTAAIIMLDALLGEAMRLRWIYDVEVVVAFSEEQRARATSIVHLPAHLESLNAGVNAVTDAD